MPLKPHSIITIDAIGNRSVSFLIPSRRRDKIPLDPGLVQRQKAKVQDVFQNTFGGVSPETPPRLGIWRHEDGSVTREEIVIVESSCSAETLTDAVIRQRITDLAVQVCLDMDQDCVFVSWGGEGLLVSETGADRQAAVVRFNQLPLESRARTVCFSWIGIRTPEHILQVLSLDGWTNPEQPVSVGDCQLLGLHAGDVKLKRVWLEPSPRHAWAKKIPQSGDLMISAGENGTDVRLFWEGRFHGPKRFYYSDAGPNRATADLLQEILGEELPDLVQDLDRKDIRRGFFHEYRDLLAQCQEIIEKQPGFQKRAFTQAQLLLGRLMFLKFIERKGWLAGDQHYVRGRFAARKGNFYKQELIPLFFDILNNDKRSLEPPELPFLNGGLFHPRENETVLNFPDELFEQLLDLFDRYTFTLDETPGTDDAMAVDPSMFGKVLESLVEPEDRKKEGIHYSPKPIAFALAFESIVARLATLTQLPHEALRRFCNGAVSALTPQQAQQVRETLAGLRVVDPAVGSGTLLLACLEVLMTIAGHCQDRMGCPLQRGAFAWGRLCREIVCGCLHGVDISEEAVEIARLRLWLAVAVGDTEPSPLPDLEFNIRKADSLLEDPALVEFTTGDWRLPLFEEDALRNDYIQAVHNYTSAGVSNPVEQHKLLVAVETAQKLLLGKLRLNSTQTAGSKKAKRKKAADDEAIVSIPFSWRLHFAHVFGERNGFDVVIANPPYVRIQNLDKTLKEAYRNRWSVLAKGNVDLFFAFIQLALDLAAPGAEIAYITPNFSKSDAGGTIRRLLAEKATIRRWVDFDDCQVFPTAANYVQLLFATNKVRERSTFDCSFVNDHSWEDQQTTDWLFRKAPHWNNLVEVPYDEPKWLTVPEEEAVFLRQFMESGTPLGDLAQITVGIQTSVDKLYLFEEWRPSGGSFVEVCCQMERRWYKLESSFLKCCVKGSREKSRTGQDIHVLWPYTDNAELLQPKELEGLFPLGWKYLKRFESKLRARENGKFNDDRWYRFGRDPQGIKAASQVKIIVPAIVRCGTAHLDEDGRLTYTASGEGGGGAWGIIVKPGVNLHLKSLAQYLQSEDVWRYYKVMGFPKQGGWRGLDQTVLAPLPIPPRILEKC